MKYEVLRTGIRFDQQRGELIQEVRPISNDTNYSFQLTCGVQSQQEIHALLSQEIVKNFSQIADGLLVRCHLIKMNFDDAEYLQADDLIVFAIHPIAFDLNSMGPFFDAFTRVYDLNGLDIVDTPQYSDFTLYEHARLNDSTLQFSIKQARIFWSALMDGYDWNRNIPLPEISRNEIKSYSNYHHTIRFTLSQELVNAQMKFTSSNNVSMFELNLAYYFIFLYKLAHGNTCDLCVACAIDRRVLAEMKSMIGTFADLLPYRIMIKTTESFTDFVLRVHGLCAKVLEHVEWPYQQVVTSGSDLSLTDFPIRFEYISSPSFLKRKETTQRKMKDATLEPYTTEKWLVGNVAPSSDFSLVVAHDSDEKTTDYTLQCSAKLYDYDTLIAMSRQFKHILLQFLSANSVNTILQRDIQMIDNHALLLPHDIEELKITCLNRIPVVVNTEKRFFFSAPASYAQARIWLDERIRFDPTKPQVAIYNMPFLYHILSGAALSITKLRQALTLTIIKHQYLRTSLVFNADENMLMHTFETDQELKSIVYDERRNPKHFDLAQGLMFRCHILHRSQTTSKDHLIEGDAIIFNFHHANFDFASMDVFYHDLNQAYTL
ncbi:unnamed protein product, partial [Rotaria magnacalcarata]